MEETNQLKLEQLKRKAYKIGLIFIVGMLILTMISKTIYTLLCPIVEMDISGNGCIQTDFYAKGKIGYDSLMITQMKVPIKASQEGQVTRCQIKENDKVKIGDELIAVGGEIDLVKQMEYTNERREIEINIGAYERTKDNLLVQCKEKKEELADKEKELQNFRDDYEIIELEQQIKQKQREADSNKVLFEAGAIAETDYDKSKNDLMLLKEKKKSLEEEHDQKINESLQELEQKIDELSNSIVEQEEKVEIEKNKLLALQEKQGTKVMHSPIEGIIYEMKIAEGAVATQGEELMVIIPNKIPITLAFSVEEEIADKIAIDSKVTWVKDQYDKTAKVIKKTYDEEKENIIITCEVDPELVSDWVTDYKTYRNVDVKMSIKSASYQCTVPTSAINYEGRDAYVYALEEEDTIFEKKYTVTKHQVQVIYEGDEKTAVQGLREQMQIVIATNKTLKDKMEVRLK